MSLRRLQAGDGALLRAVRLQALLDAPWAFDSPYAEEAAFSDDQWEERALQSERGERGVIFVAEDSGVAIGMAGGFFPDHCQPRAILWGMWVHPTKRRSGTATEMVEAVIGWAREIGAGELALSVSQDERTAAAASLYRGCGFRDTGDRGVLRADPLIALEDWSLPV